MIFPLFLIEALSRSYSVGVSFTSCQLTWTRRWAKLTLKGPAIQLLAQCRLELGPYDEELREHALTLITSKQVRHNHRLRDTVKPALCRVLYF